jgi:hypothetical protein
VRRTFPSTSHAPLQVLEKVREKVRDLIHAPPLMHSSKVIQYLLLPTAGGDSRCCRYPNRLTFPSRTAPSEFPQECPRITGTTSPKFLRQSLTCSLSLQVTIGELSDEVLLNIFCYYLDAFQRFWPRLRIFVADGDVSYLRPNELYTFDCSVRTEYPY